MLKTRGSVRLQAGSMLPTGTSAHLSTPGGGLKPGLTGPTGVFILGYTEPLVRSGVSESDCSSFLSIGRCDVSSFLFLFSLTDMR